MGAGSEGTDSNATTRNGQHEVNGDTPPGRVLLRVLGRFELLVGRRSVALGMSSKRLLTLLAIRGGRVNRVWAAGTLWPDATTERANANLRSALWRLQRCCSVVEASFYDVAIAPEVEVDIMVVAETVRRLLDRSTPLHADELREALHCNLFDDLIPDLGDEEWLIAERERHRQLRVHALEALAEQLIAAGWRGAAVEAALAAVRADPFRESAHVLLIKASLAEGNLLQAHSQMTRYRNLLHSELGLEPTADFLCLLDGYDVRPDRPERLQQT